MVYLKLYKNNTEYFFRKQLIGVLMWKYVCTVIYIYASEQYWRVRNGASLEGVAERLLMSRLRPSRGPDNPSGSEVHPQSTFGH